MDVYHIEGQRLKDDRLNASEDFVKSMIINKLNVQNSSHRTTSLSMYRPTPVYNDVTENKTVSKFDIEYPKIIFGNYIPCDLRRFVLFLLVTIFTCLVSIINLSLNPVVLSLFFASTLIFIFDWKPLNKEILLSGKFSLSRVKSVETEVKSRIVINQRDIDIFNKLSVLHDFYNTDTFFTNTAKTLLLIKEKLRTHETLLTHEQLWFMNTCHEYLLELYSAYKLVSDADFNVKHEVRNSVRDSIVVFNERLDEIDKQISASITEESRKKIKFVNACFIS